MKRVPEKPLDFTYTLYITHPLNALGITVASTTSPEYYSNCTIIQLQLPTDRKHLPDRRHASTHSGVTISVEATNSPAPTAFADAAASHRR